MNYLKLVSDKLCVENITDLVTSPTCGAVSVFIGTTRDNFEDKSVLQLEYEAYDDMAIKSLQKICNDIRKHWPSIENIAIYHRLGTVPVKEASIVIAISSPHRAEAMAATQWCIDNVKKSVPIWKKEIYANDDTPEWKENKESKCFSSKIPKSKIDTKQDIHIPYVSPHLIQVKASHVEIEDRINKFMERKRSEVDRCNIRDFCRKEPDTDDEYSCARIDSILVKRKDSKGHLRVNRVYNSYSYRDQHDYEYLTKFIPRNGIDERLHNLESQLSLKTPASSNVYVRLKKLENRLLHLESISPEYVQFWVQDNLSNKPAKRKKVFSLHEIDSYISELELRKANQSSRQ